MKNQSEKEFITFEGSQIGFVTYGLGGGAWRVHYRGEALADFLKQLEPKMLALQKELNETWKWIDTERLENPANRLTMQKILATGSWAYALTLDMIPFQEHCLDGPTNPLRFYFIQRLEEIYLQCFSTAHVYGNPDESMIGLRGLLTDFEHNGGIDKKTGGPGAGFNSTILRCFQGHFWPATYAPLMYQRFGELVDKIGTALISDYPKTSLSLYNLITSMMTAEHGGFASTTIRSEAKSQMLERLKLLMAKLDLCLQKLTRSSSESEKTRDSRLA